MEKFNLDRYSKDLKNTKEKVASSTEEKVASSTEELQKLEEFFDNKLPLIIQSASEDYQKTMRSKMKKAIDDNDLQTAQSIMNDINEHVENLKNLVTIEYALEVMGESQFIGPDDIQNTFGFTPDTIPEIPFSPSELERARELGQQLILYIDTKADGTPFTMEDMIPSDNKTSDGKVFLYNKDNDGNWLYKDTEAKLRSETPRLGWRLTTPEVIEGSTDKNYLEQTETLIEYLKNEHFKGVDIPKVYEEAIDEFTSVNTPELKEKVKSTKESEWQEAARILSELSINELTRERSSEIIYRLAINEKKLGVKNLASKYAWSISLDADGKLVPVGYFAGDGLVVSGWAPGPSDGILGICFSAGIRG